MVNHREIAGLEPFATQYGYDPYQHGSDTGWFGSKIVKSVKKAVKTVAKTAKTVYRKAAALPGIDYAIGKVTDQLKYTPYGAIGGAALGAMKAGIRGQSLASIAEAAARGAVPSQIMAAIDLSLDAIKGKNIIRAALERAGAAFVPGSPEAIAFNMAKTLLTGGNVTAQALATARGSLGSEGERRALDTAVGAAAKAAETAKKPAALSTLPKVAGKVTKGRAVARHVPLSPRAAQVIGSKVRSVTFGAINGRRETAGLSPDAATYTVEAGDSAWKITQKLTSNGNRYRELLAANKDRPQTGEPTPNFKFLNKGNVLKLPGTWKSLLAPTLKADVINQARAILKVWGDTDGLRQAGVTDYGQRPEDLSTVWGPRDRLMTTSFANWRNAATGKRLSVTGDLTDQIADELRLWASEHAHSPGAAATQTPTDNVPPAVQSAPVPITGNDQISSTQPAWTMPENAAPTAAKKNPLSGTRSVPDDVSAMAAAAQSSGDPVTMRKVANALYAQGWWNEADILNANADELEARQMGVPSPTASNVQTMPNMTVIGTAPATAPAAQGGDDLGFLAIAGLVVAKLAHIL